MKTKLKTIVAITAIIIVFVVLFVLLINRCAFGVWNPFELPSRVQCFGRTYYNHAKGDTIIDESETLIKIDTSDNKTSKELYTLAQGDTYINDPVPTAIYLKVDEDSYHVYELSGGP